MSSEPTQPEPMPEAPKQRSSVHDRRLTRQQAKPNRSQVKAAQTRSAQQSVATVAEPSAILATTATAVPGSSTKMTAAQRRAMERGVAGRGTGMPVGATSLSRADEMLMVREDLRLLLLIAGSLLVGMIVLLFFID